MKWRQETFLGWSFMEREPININLKPNTYLILIHPVAFELQRTCNWVRNKKSQPHPVLWLLTPTSVLLPPCANFPATQWTRLGKWPSSDANMAKSCFRRIEFPTKFTPGCMNAEPRLRRRQEGSAVRNLGHITVMELSPLLDTVLPSMPYACWQNREKGWAKRNTVDSC